MAAKCRVHGGEKTPGQWLELKQLRQLHPKLKGQCGATDRLMKGKEGNLYHWVKSERPLGWLCRPLSGMWLEFGLVQLLRMN